METRVLVICRGIQGSGKTSFAKQWCHEDPEHRVRFNNDDIRNMLGDYWVPNREKLVTEAKANMITFALIKGYDVVVDNMNLNPKEDEWIRTLCANIEKDKGIHVDIEYKDFWTPVDECIRRDAKREHPIGEKVIRQTWKRYKDFIIHEEIMAAPWMLIGMIVGLVALFACPVLMAECFCLALVFITIDRYYEIKDEKNGNR